MSYNNSAIVKDFSDYKNYVINSFLEKYKNENKISRDILDNAIDITHLMKGWKFLTIYLTIGGNPKELSIYSGMVMNNTNIIIKTDDITYRICYDDNNCRNYNANEIIFINLKIIKRKYILSKLIKK